MTCPHVYGYPFHQERIGRGVTGESVVGIYSYGVLSVYLANSPVSS